MGGTLYWKVELVKAKQVWVVLEGRQEGSQAKIEGNYRIFLCIFILIILYSDQASLLFYFFSAGLSRNFPEFCDHTLLENRRPTRIQKNTTE